MCAADERGGEGDKNLHWLTCSAGAAASLTFWSLWPSDFVRRNDSLLRSRSEKPVQTQCVSKQIKLGTLPTQ